MNSDPEQNSVPDETMPGWLYGVGFILAISYPVLAVSVGFRAVYRLCCSPDIANYLPPALSAITAGFYAVATIGFTRRARWAWWVSLISLSLETVLTFVVGGLSLTSAYGDVIGRTAWRAFGQDYGYLPLFQPVLGIVWLLHPLTRATYAIGGRLRHAPADTP